MTITTKKGDSGRSCWEGVRAGKEGLFLAAMGDVDELSAIFQLIGSRFGDKEWDDLVVDLGKIMGMLAGKGDIDLGRMIEVIEKEIEKGEKELDRIGGFISFKTEKGVMINWARTVSRRAERRVVAWSKKGKVAKEMLMYFNRLSDYLFILARKAE